MTAPRAARRGGSRWLAVFTLGAALWGFWPARADDALPCCDGQTLRFRYLEGARGHIDFQRAGRELRFISLETMQANTHSCALKTQQVCIMPSTPGPRITPACGAELEKERMEKGGPSTQKEAGLCRISVALSGGGLKISYDDHNCRGYCGAWGEFEGAYELVRRLPQPHLR